MVQYKQSAQSKLTVFNTSPALVQQLAQPAMALNNGCLIGGRTMMWYLASLCVLSLLCIFAHGAPVADSSPADDSAALADSAESTTEDLDFKDVPIYPKDKPPAGFKYVLVTKCKKTDVSVKNSSLPAQVSSSIPLVDALKPVEPPSKLHQDELSVTQIVENVKNTVHKVAAQSSQTLDQINTVLNEPLVVPTADEDLQTVPPGDALESQTDLVSTTTVPNDPADEKDDEVEKVHLSTSQEDSTVSANDVSSTLEASAPKPESDSLVKEENKEATDNAVDQAESAKTGQEDLPVDTNQDSTATVITGIASEEDKMSPASFDQNDSKNDLIKVEAETDRPLEEPITESDAVEPILNDNSEQVDEELKSENELGSIYPFRDASGSNKDVPAKNLPKVAESTKSTTGVHEIKKDESFEMSGEMLMNQGSKAGADVDVVKDYTGYKVYRVVIPTELAAKWILKFEDLPGIEFWADPKLLLRPRGLFVTSAADIMVAPDITEYIEEAFIQARLPYEVLIPNLQEAIRNENPAESLDEDLANRNGHRMTWDRYHSYEDIDSYLEYLKVAFPKFASVVEIGHTTEGRPIKAVKLHQEGGRIDKKAIFLDAGIHAREWITPATLMYMMRELVEGSPKYDCILDQFDFYFVPVVNPDGYVFSHTNNRMWRKTRSKPNSIVFRKMAEENLKADRLARFQEDPVLDDTILEKLRMKVINDKAILSCTGVDANRNFDYFWLTGGSSRNPCVDNYAGHKAFSEPETRALSNYIMNNKDQIAMYISLHAYSQMWLLPWGYKEEKPSDYSDLFSMAKIGANALEKVHKTDYLIGSIPDLLYAASGSAIDWVKGAAGVKYAFTLELRDSGRYGFILPAQQIIPTGEETWAAVYASAVELAKRIYPEATSCPSL